MLRSSLVCVMALGALVAAPGVFSQSTPPRGVPEGLRAADWSGIRAAYEASRHRAYPVEAGYRARNPGQQWSTFFDGSGFRTEPDAGGWTWGLQLQCYGFSGQERAVVRPQHISAKGQRVAYDWDATLTEWYVNDARGLEHGYTVHRRLAHHEAAEADAMLTFTLAVHGALLPRVAADGRSVRFVDADGAARLSYSGLTVFDADGKSLPARLQAAPEGLLLTVDERGARYPLTIDPVTQQAYLKASNTDGGDSFGVSVAISGNTVVVGAAAEASGATGVNGDQSDNSADISGAVYVFVSSGTNWVQEAYLKASNTGTADFFGQSVAISGNTLVVGARAEDSSATGVNGNESSNNAEDSGAAYVFVRNGTSWSQQAYLKASNTDGSPAWYDTGDAFGHSVAVSGDTVVVGARQEDSGTSGVNGNQSSNSSAESGAAYIFVRNGASWSQQAYLKASNTDTFDWFGESVAVSSNTVIVSAGSEDSGATGVNGNQNDNSVPSAGAAYVFVRNGTSWSQQAYLKASNTDAVDAFGGSVASSGDTVVVGAFGEDSNTTGVNGNQNDNSVSSAGAAYVFVRSGTSWSQQAYLKASNTGSGDSFGSSVALSGATAVIGAFFENSKATGVNGDQNDNSSSNAGAAYVFVRNGTTWSQQVYLKASNTDKSDLFGFAVAVSGHWVVTGASREASNSSGVNGNQNDNSATYAGAAYVFEISDVTPDPWSDQGSALAGLLGDPLLVGGGTLAEGSSNSVGLSNAAPSTLAALFLSLSSTPVPFKGGTLMAFPFLPPVYLSTSATGTIDLPFQMPVGAPVGTNLWVQWGILDVAAIAGVSLSNAILGVTP